MNTSHDHNRINWRSRIIRYDKIRADQVTPHPMNPFIHPQAQREAVAASFDELGQLLPIIINQRNGYLVDGEERTWLALAQGDDTELDVAYVDLSDEEHELALTLINPTTKMSQLEADKLVDLLRSIETDNAALQSLLSDLAQEAGLTFDESSVLEDAGPQIDRAAELQSAWQVKRGDVWIIGKHRLMCGDSTSADDVARLMGGAKADMMWTDPPYNVDYTGGTEENLKIENDSMSNTEFRAFLNNCFKSADNALRNGAVYYIAHSDAFAYEFIGAVRDTGWIQARPPTIQWIKDSLVLGRGDYHSRSEPILYGWKSGAAHHALTDRSQDNVWEIARPKSSEEHPTMKPVELISRSLKNSSKQGSLVFDPFLGSGTTMIACEQTGRVCYGIEISPEYCSVTLQRLKDMGLTPVRDTSTHEIEF